MKRKLKQICAFVLLVSMIFSGFTNETVAVSAAETDSIVSGECGENVYYELNTTTGVLRIYGTGPMADYGSYTDKNYQYAPWVEKYASIITKVKIENGVTSIGDYAFCGQQYNSTYHCVNLDSVDIANSVMRIGKGSFWGSSNLKTITIPSGVEEIEFGAFCGTALTDIQWGDSIVTIGESAFWGNKFTDLNLPLHIQNIGTSAFGRCRSLKSVKIPANCEVGYQAFEMCEVLESVKISDNCEVGYQAFKDCEVLESVEFGNNCKIHGGVFEKCALLN